MGDAVLPKVDGILCDGLAQLLELLVEQLQVAPVARAHQVCAYQDPGPRLACNRASHAMPPQHVRRFSAHSTRTLTHCILSACAATHTCVG